MDVVLFLLEKIVRIDLFNVVSVLPKFEILDFLVVVTDKPKSVKHPDFSAFFWVFIDAGDDFLAGIFLEIP